MPDYGTRLRSAERGSGPLAAASSGGAENGRRLASSTADVSPLGLAEVSDGMIVRHLTVTPSEVVFVKGVIEASDGVAAVFAESGGELSIVCPPGREAELAELLRDLAREVDPPQSRSAPELDGEVVQAGMP